MAPLVSLWPHITHQSVVIITLIMIPRVQTWRTTHLREYTTACPPHCSLVYIRVVLIMQEKNEQIMCKRTTFPGNRIAHLVSRIITCVGSGLSLHGHVTCMCMCMHVHVHVHDTHLHNGRTHRGTVSHRGPLAWLLLKHRG